MKKLLWLDDIRNPNDSDWLKFSPIDKPYETFWVKSYVEFISWINDNGLPEAICFDHDLADNFELRKDYDINSWFNLEEGKEYTGYDCTKWLVDYCMDNNEKLPLWAIQSANPVGAENINNYLLNYKKIKGED